jgi:hypothetical protein
VPTSDGGIRKPSAIAADMRGPAQDPLLRHRRASSCGDQQGEMAAPDAQFAVLIKSSGRSGNRIAGTFLDQQDPIRPITLVRPS